MKQNTNLDRIIAKIDNDFNPDNSDWIPRVGSWVIDAMSMLDCLRTETKKIALPVEERIVTSSINIFDGNFKVYTKDGCKVVKAVKVENEDNFKDDPFTGEVTQTNTTGTTDYLYNPNGQESVTQAITNNCNCINHRYNVVELKYNNHKKRNYVILSPRQLELNFDTNYIIVEYSAIATYKSTDYDIELPVIPNNGLLIEAIAYYCLYKMLCRGYRHPVFNLQASQYGTNPYYIWNDLKDKAKRSVIKDEQGEIIDDGGIWRSALFISSFDPKNN